MWLGGGCRGGGGFGGEETFFFLQACVCVWCLDFGLDVGFGEVGWFRRGYIVIVLCAEFGVVPSLRCRVFSPCLP